MYRSFAGLRCKHLGTGRLPIPGLACAVGNIVTHPWCGSSSSNFRLRICPAASCDGFKRYFEFFYYDDLWHMAHCNPFVLPQVVTDLRGSSKLFGVKMCGTWIPCHGAEAPWIGSTSITPDQTNTSLVFWCCKERCFQEIKVCVTDVLFLQHNYQVKTQQDSVRA